MQENVGKRRKMQENDKHFEIYEKVLCFEPDTKKAKVLYDAKIMDICETKDKRGRKKIEFLIHFQGWSSSWDRRVPDDFVLKDTEENRKLQRDLADQSQLQLGAYLYRKERKKRRKLSEKIRLLQLKANPENSDGTNPEKINEVKPIAIEIDSDKITTDQEMDYSSSVDDHEDDRVFLCLGEIVHKNLELDAKIVTKDKVLVKLPATLNVVTILENFVRYYTFKQITGQSQEFPKPKKRNKQIVKQKDATQVFDLQTIENNIELCKEVADGLRIYFNFILQDYLLYPEERDQANEFLSIEYLRNFVFVRNDMKIDVLQTKQTVKPDSLPDQEICETSSKSETGRRLRSHSNRNDENENLSSMASTSSNDSEPLASVLSAQRPQFKTSVPLSIATIPPMARKLFEETLAWKLLQDDTEQEASMIYGIVHLTRLVVKLPEFLSATPINEEKLILLLKFLNHFVEFLEDHEYLYGEQNYKINGNVSVKLEKSDSQENVTIIDSYIDIKPEQIQESPLIIEKKSSNIEELVDERFK